MVNCKSLGKQLLFVPSEKLILSHSLDRGGMLEPVLRSDIGDALKEAIGNTVRCDEMGGGTQRSPY